MSTCVYWIRHPDHTDMFCQGYIGVSSNPEKRFEQHSKLTHNARLKEAIQQYGWDNIVKSVILIAERNYCFDVEKKLRPAEGIGWNIMSGGGRPPIMRGPQPKLRGRVAWNKGKFLSESTKEKLRQASLQQWKDPEMRALLSGLKKGKPSHRVGIKHTPESIAKMSASHKGKPSKKKGTKLYGIALQNVINASRAKWFCPHCKTDGMGKGAGNRWHFDNCKQKVAE